MIKSKINRTVNRKKEDVLEVQIVKSLLNSINPKSTQEIADEIQKPWHSIQTRCLRLQLNQKVIGFRVGRINLWQIKK
jgi:repressor of nif and glnA expression